MPNKANNQTQPDFQSLLVEEAALKNTTSFLVQVYETRDRKQSKEVEEAVGGFCSEVHLYVYQTNKKGMYNTVSCHCCHICLVR